MAAALLFGSGTALIQVSLVLGGILGVLVVVGRYLKGPARPSGTVIALTPSHSLHVVDVDGKRLLVGTGPQGAPRLIEVLSPAARVDSGSEASARAARPSFQRDSDAG